MTFGLRTGCGWVALGCRQQRLRKPTSSDARSAALPPSSTRATRGRSIESDRLRAEESELMTQSSTHPATDDGVRPADGGSVGRFVRANLSTAELYEDAIRAGEGLIAAEGPLVVRTGKHTGRSPKDKFIVREPSTAHKIW